LRSVITAGAVITSLAGFEVALFGGDSAIELLSAVVVLWRFRADTLQEQIERRAARIVGVLLFVLAAIIVKPLRYHRREVRVYFQDAQGLHAGASVRMAGVDIGSVSSVRVRPEPPAPAEVVMVLHTM
jgi:MlaD protein